MLPVVAVVVDYAAGPVLQESVRALLAQCAAVVVIDNASPLPSSVTLGVAAQNEAGALAGERPGDCGSGVFADAMRAGRLVVARADCNGGFAQGCNLGVRVWQARELPGAVRAGAWWFVNPDAIAATNAAKGLTAVLNSVPQAGAVGGRLLDEDARMSWGAASSLPGLGDVWRRWVLGQRLAPAKAGEAGPFAAEATSGACMMVRREAFEAVGGWDEDYFLYFEDLDFCMRLREAGWQVWVTEQAECRHLRGVCSGRLASGWRGLGLRAQAAWHKHRGAMRFLHRYWFKGWRWAMWPVVAAAVWLHGLVEPFRPGR